MFDHEKLEVYQLELRFLDWVNVLIEEIKKNNPGPIVREICDHLGRAALSSLFNTAEGNGKRQMKIRSRYFDIARGSATECASCLDALVVVKACNQERILEGEKLLFRIVSMLTKLVIRFDSDLKIREEEVEYGVENEDDIEDEKGTQGKDKESRTRTSTTMRNDR